MAKVSKKEPLISIIVPVYNGEKYIKNTINNLLKVTCDKEIIVINDCSVDKSYELLKKYEKNIKLINLKENNGVSNARNLGLEVARGKYIGFVDIDDSFEFDIFNKMIEKIESENSDVCVCNYDEIDEVTGLVTSSKYKLNYLKTEKKSAIKLFLTDQISPAIWDKIYRRDLLEKIRFNKNLAVGEDILFCLNVFLKVNSVSFCNEYLYHYLQQNNSVMHKISPKLLQFSKVIENIDLKNKKLLLNEYKEEYEYFKLEMVTRGIHSISSLCNKNNKKIAKQYLMEYCTKDNLNGILKNKYYSKFIKLEILIIKMLGIDAHLILMPVYKFVRSKIR